MFLTEIFGWRIASGSERHSFVNNLVVFMYTHLLDVGPGEW